MKRNSKVIKRTKDGWEGIAKKVYKTDNGTFKDISRFSLLGEGEQEHELNMQTRYFEVESGGFSTLEYHRHPHSVVIIKGSGSMILGDEVIALDLHDVVYISPETLHQFQADRGTELGFICVVDRYRDRPSLPDETTLDEQLGKNTPARQKARTGSSK